MRNSSSKKFRLPKAAIRRVAVPPPGRLCRRPAGVTAYITVFGVSKITLAGAAETEADFGISCVLRLQIESRRG